MRTLYAVTPHFRSRVHTGTTNFTSVLTVPAALALHGGIGLRAKELRLRHLRDYWVSRARAMMGIEILTPDEPGMAAGITPLRLVSKTSAADNTALVTQLREKFGIFSVRRGGVAKGQCLRISPALSTTEADLGPSGRSPGIDHGVLIDRRSEQALRRGRAGARHESVMRRSRKACLLAGRRRTRWRALRYAPRRWM